MVTYWAQLLTCKENKLNRLLYNIMSNLYNANVFKCQWLIRIKEILDICGLSDLFANSNNINKNWIKLAVKRRLSDQFLQIWNTELSEHTLYSNYKGFKEEFKLEDYIKNQPFVISKSLIRFRTSNHNLAVERGRHFGIVREARICNKCNLNQLGDEYHLLVECQDVDVVENRAKYIPKYYYLRPSAFKYVQLMKKAGSSYKLANKLGMFLKKCLY